MNEQENAEQFVIKDSITVEGISTDYVWYESSKLINEMNLWELKFKRVVDTMEARHKEHLNMIEDLLRQNKKLKEQLEEVKK